MSRRQSTTRSPSRPFERARTSSRHEGHNPDLKRKSVFVMHEEIRKPVTTISLEEISDISRITDMCLKTLTSMMKSKTYRKYLHHMNNNALLVDEYFQDKTHNATPGKEKRLIPKYNIHEFTSITEQDDMEDSQGLQMRVSIGNLNPMVDVSSSFKVPGMTMDYEDYSRQALETRKRRKDELAALKRLGRGLPPIKKKVHKEANFPLVHDVMSANNYIVPEDNTKRTDQEIIENDNFEEITLPTHKVPEITAEELLRCKWLRLTAEQVEKLENEMRATGKNPGIHAHSKIQDINTAIFAKDEDYEVKPPIPIISQTRKSEGMFRKSMSKKKDRAGN